MRSAAEPTDASPHGERTRNSMLDVARGLGIILVIYGHSLEVAFFRSDPVFVASAFEQWRVIYSFHMPLFFVVSGAAHLGEGRGGSSADRGISRDTVVKSAALLAMACAHHVLGVALRIAHERSIAALTPAVFFDR